MKKFISLITILFFSYQASALTILLDPGHGGDEYGATSKDSKLGTIHEKDLNLKLAKIIQDKLRFKHSVYLTRSYDKTISLQERADMADKVNADLFISIHFNSSHHKKHRGFETYYLDNSVAAIKKVESAEGHDHYNGKIDESINKILIDLVVSKTSSQSRKLSQKVHSNISRNIKKDFRMKDRGIKPGLFYVLALSKRPGVLLEAGFVSNSKELKKITSDKFLHEYANSVVEGINDYSSKQTTALAKLQLYNL